MGRLVKRGSMNNAIKRWESEEGHYDGLLRLSPESSAPFL